MRGGLISKVGRWAAVVLVVALVSGTAHVAYRAWWLPSWRSWPSQPFTPDKWRSTTESERYVYWKDMRNRKLLVGASRQEVIDLLGPPNADRGVFLMYAVKNPDPREYTFNGWYGIHLDLDGHGRVTRAFIRPRP